MVKTKVEITKEDLQKIDDLKNGIGCLSKEIMYTDEPEIKSLSGLEYVTKSEYLDKSLMMKHSLVNPREGEEVEVEIIKLDC